MNTPSEVRIVVAGLVLVAAWASALPAWGQGPDELRQQWRSAHESPRIAAAWDAKLKTIDHLIVDGE